MNQAPIFNGDRIRVYYGSQVDTKPPTFVIFVNKKEKSPENVLFPRLFFGAGNRG